MTEKVLSDKCEYDIKLHLMVRFHSGNFRKSCKYSFIPLLIALLSSEVVLPVRGLSMGQKSSHVTTCEDRCTCLGILADGPYDHMSIISWTILVC